MISRGSLQSSPFCDSVNLWYNNIEKILHQKKFLAVRSKCVSVCPAPKMALYSPAVIFAGKTLIISAIFSHSFRGELKLTANSQDEQLRSAQVLLTQFSGSLSFLLEFLIYHHKYSAKIFSARLSQPRLTSKHMSVCPYRCHTLLWNASTCKIEWVISARILSLLHF